MGVIPCTRKCQSVTSVTFKLQVKKKGVVIALHTEDDNEFD